MAGENLRQGRNGVGVDFGLGVEMFEVAVKIVNQLHDEHGEGGVKVVIFRK